MEPDLKPCPFCGGTKLKIDSKRTFRHGGKKHCSVTVRCMKCHARSPVVGINMANGQYNEREICENAIIEVWNRRASVVAHGRWKPYHEADIGYDEYGVRCSNCGFEVEDHEVEFSMHYCPNCGVKMDGGAAHGET